ncbi:selection and upkeep of intraepithelial T-cells protein 2-like isoform X1 [Xenopus tropicalis]|uniref:Selection and upkeep of intraepithelial T-cells protein 2-like isoform X1 n=2 Tax=Xenopus tropicalis TaxID=8364 RepID=A0A8J1IU72_XENTR|nr:selection and upkeep of intraepithelial T-cells protein 2-like isoform X1 [Xenopus tropicalis]
MAKYMLYCFIFPHCRFGCLFGIIMASTMHSIKIPFFILWSVYKVSLPVRIKVSSTRSVSVTVGSDVVLPCRLIPEMNAENMKICWFKTKFQPCVHFYSDGKDDYSAQVLEFANRTELLKENITRGSFPLKIRNVTAEDSGEYYCNIDSNNHHGLAIVQLDVTAVGSLPYISSVNADTVYCESCDWLPKPYLIWADNEGNNIIPLMEKVHTNKENLYCISSIISITAAVNITCTVSNALNQSKQSSGHNKEKRLPAAPRDTCSRIIIISASVMICCVCLFLLLKKHPKYPKIPLGMYPNTAHSEKERKYSN